VLAVLDTGVDPNHTDLRGRLLAGYDYVNNDSNPADDNGHGTSVAGVAAANTNNAAGIAGACWSCSILPVKVLGASGSGGWAAVANGLTYAADRGAHVINLSLGGSSGSETLRSAVAYAQSKGAVVVAAAGNSGGTAQMFPAAYPGVVSVAGSQSNDSRYSWSQYGSWVKVAAPGCSPAPRPGGSYSTVCGTSFASPLVAGIAGLMRSANPSASATTVAGALQTTSTSVSYVQYGRVDAAAAVAAVTAPGTAPEPAPAPGPGTTTTFSGNLNGGGGSRSFTVDAGQGALSAALSFSRSPSMTVTLLDSSGRTLARAAGGSPVRLTADVAAGRHTLVVADGKGAFSLVVTHAS
jgi:subtilisin family serine protease